MRSILEVFVGLLSAFLVLCDWQRQRRKEMQWTQTERQTETARSVVPTTSAPRAVLKCSPQKLKSPTFYAKPRSLTANLGF